MSFNHTHKGVPCQNIYCALPRDTGVGSNAATEKELVEMPRAEFERHEGKRMSKFNASEVELRQAAEQVLRGTTGLDTDSEHGRHTPDRFIKMLRELTTPTPIEFTTFKNDGMDEMIVVEAIPFVSLCNHHVVPFIGKAYIGYIPDDQIAGLSKFARVVHHFARRLQVQEQLTKDIADFLEENLKPLGVAVVLRAEHFCMTIRGVQVPGTKTYTAAMRGRFSEHERTAKAEFLAEINGGNHG